MHSCAVSTYCRPRDPAKNIFVFAGHAVDFIVTFHLSDAAVVSFSFSWLVSLLRRPTRWLMLMIGMRLKETISYAGVWGWRKVNFNYLSWPDTCGMWMEYIQSSRTYQPLPALWNKSNCIRLCASKAFHISLTLQDGIDGRLRHFLPRQYDDVQDVCDCSKHAYLNRDRDGSLIDFA